MGDLQTFAVLVAEDINAVEYRLTAAEGRLDTALVAEDLAPLEGRVTAAEGRLTAAEGRLDATLDADDLAPLEGRMSSAETRLTSVEASQGGTSLANAKFGEGAPVGGAPVGFWHYDVLTGDIYRMEA